MKLRSIKEIFANERIFVIPDYQRGYAWETKHVKDLWDDILTVQSIKPESNSKKSNPEFHYANLLTLKESGSGDIKEYKIVDGQQRLTTLLILIKVMLEQRKESHMTFEVDDAEERYFEKNGKLKFTYERDNPYGVFFTTKILGLKNPSHVKEDKEQNNIYKHNLQNAKKFFADELKKKDEDFLKKLFTTVTQNVRFNEYILEGNLNEYLVFEMTNNRGKKVSLLEVLKNRLMYLSEYLYVSNTDRVDELRNKN